MGKEPSKKVPFHFQTRIYLFYLLIYPYLRGFRLQGFFGVKKEHLDAVAKSFD